MAIFKYRSFIVSFLEDNILESSKNTYTAEFKGKFSQGSFILGLTEPGSEVTIDKKKIRVSKDGYFVFGLDQK